MKFSSDVSYDSANLWENQEYPMPFINNLDRTRAYFGTKSIYIMNMCAGHPDWENVCREER